MKARMPILLATAVILATTSVTQASHIPGATYVGTAEGGGTIEIDVSADGSSVTRFHADGVNTSCGTLTDTTASGSYSIASHGFSSGSPTAVGLRFSGSFDSVQHAQGVVSLKIFLGMGYCTSLDVPWTATTTAVPPDGNGNGGGDDTTPPEGTLGGPASQRLGNTVKTKYTASEAASVVAAGNIVIKAPASFFAAKTKSYKLKPAKASVQAGETKTLKPRLSEKVQRIAKKALKKGGKVIAKLKVKATDLAGNAAAPLRRTIKLKR